MNRSLVLDANILIRAVLGQRVRRLIVDYHERVALFAPRIAFDDAQRHLPGLIAKRGIDPVLALDVADQIASLVVPVDAADYEAARDAAVARIARRDVADWPVIALALVFDCPIWTEDNDFFGTGIPTWTTDRVELYFRNT